MALGERGPVPVSRHISPKQRDKGMGSQGARSVSYLDQCLPLSLGQVLRLAISLFPFLPYLE